MKQMKHMKRTELADQRTANRKVFENQDHSRTVEIYLEPVHYQDRGGNWKEMDDTLQETETPQNLQRFREKEIFSGKFSLFTRDAGFGGCIMMYCYG